MELCGAGYDSFDLSGVCLKLMGIRCPLALSILPHSYISASRLRQRPSQETPQEQISDIV